MCAKPQEAIEDLRRQVAQLERGSQPRKPLPFGVPNVERTE
jgi:protein ImuA